MIPYPPLDALKPVGNGIWVVDSGPIKAGGLIPLPVRMTVKQLIDGSIDLHSPTHSDEGLRQEIEKCGAIHHVVAPQPNLSLTSCKQDRFTTDCYGCRN